MGVRVRSNNVFCSGKAAVSCREGSFFCGVDDPLKCFFVCCWAASIPLWGSMLWCLLLQNDASIFTYKLFLLRTCRKCRRCCASVTAAVVLVDQERLSVDSQDFILWTLSTQSQFMKMGGGGGQLFTSWSLGRNFYLVFVFRVKLLLEHHTDPFWTFSQ